MSWSEAQYIISAFGGKRGPGGSGDRKLVATVTPPHSYKSTPATVEVDCTSIEEYEELTVNNFAVVPVKISASAYDGSSGGYGGGGNLGGRSLTPTMTYDPTTGKLTLSNFSFGWRYDYGTYWNQSITVKITYNVYCYY